MCEKIEKLLFMTLLGFSRRASRFSLWLLPLLHTAEPFSMERWEFKLDLDSEHLPSSTRSETNTALSVRDTRLLRLCKGQLSYGKHQGQDLAASKCNCFL